MGSVDASRSCASNPGRRFGIGRLIVEVRIVLYVARNTLVVDYVCNRRDWFLRFEPSSNYCNPRSPSRLISPFRADFITLISILFGLIDASHSCGSNAGRLFGIGQLVVEIIYAYYFVEQSGGRLGCGGHTISFECEVSTCTMSS